MKVRVEILGALLAVAVTFTGCGASSKYESAASAPMAMDMAVTEEAAVEEYYAEEPMEAETTAGMTANGEVSKTV
jgi:hypothetical protein